MNKRTADTPDRRTTHHQCGPGWAYCSACNGRMHKAGCTSRKNPTKDCCPARHKQLHDAGQTRGIGDDSLIMWTPNHPYGCHYSETTTEEAN